MLTYIILANTYKLYTNTPLTLKDHEVIVDDQYITPRLQTDTSSYTLSPDLFSYISHIVEVPTDIEATITHIQSITNDLKNGRDTFLVFFTDSIELHTSHKYFVSSDKEMAQRVVGHFPGLYVYNASDKVEYKLKLTKESIEIATTPVFDELTNELLAKFENTKLAKFYLFYESVEQLVGFREVVIKYRHDAKVGHLAFKKEGSLKHMGVADSEMPAIVAIHEGAKYSAKNLDCNTLDDFLSSFVDKTLEPFELSEGDIEDEDDEVLLMHRTTRKMYKNGDYNKTLFFFVSKNCGFCTQIKPIIKELIAKNKSSVKICIVDGTKNDFSEFKIRGYPTILYLEDGKQTYFDGERKVERFVEFVKKNSKDGIDITKEEEREEL